MDGRAFSGQGFGVEGEAAASNSPMPVSMISIFCFRQKRFNDLALRKRQQSHPIDPADHQVFVFLLLGQHGLNSL
ncbi:MAG: hypothetical protein A2286_04715 [Gammaproteobacteria bacterium RIFOXYA12_FULL_61_12]|nr:MAG: hypothetical protein A2514_12555 [Gammaproteobacteria bacterium RIFOXYD12_FULL_61_37]OGT93999.1 MAG: hypothetical protein A2286_04715 [Gammaproteobacteria bacterium RIFOXYA12_FULL_61_12]